MTDQETDQENPTRFLWQNQPQEDFTMSIEDIKRRTSNFTSIIVRRNAIEYAVGLLLIISFTVSAVLTRSDFSRLALIVSIIGIATTLYQLFRRAGAPMPLDTQPASQLAHAYRAELIRQRNALNSIWIWYLGPLVPGMTLYWIAAGLKNINGENPLWGIAVTAAGLSVCALVFFAVAAMNKQAAKKLQLEIDSLDRLCQDDRRSTP